MFLLVGDTPSTMRTFFTLLLVVYLASQALSVYIRADYEHEQHGNDAVFGKQRTVQCEPHNVTELTVGRFGFYIIQKTHGWFPQCVHMERGWLVGYGHLCPEPEENTVRSYTVEEKSLEGQNGAAYVQDGLCYMCDFYQNKFQVHTTSAWPVLKEDVKRCEKQVRDEINVELTRNQFAALVSFCMTVSAEEWQASYIKELLNDDHDFDDVANVFLSHSKDSGKESHYLSELRQVEVRLWKTNACDVREERISETIDHLIDEEGHLKEHHDGEFPTLEAGPALLEIDLTPQEM